MTSKQPNTDLMTWVAMDIAKNKNDVLVESPTGKQKRFKVANKLEDFQQFVEYLCSVTPCIIGFEATGNYHRAIAYYLQSKGFELRLISSLASSKTREAIFNSWDKNDPKDAQVILHLLKTNITQVYYDPLINQTNDLQELSKTLEQLSLRKMKVQHSIFTHYLPLYFPEAQQYFHSSRAQWFSNLLLAFPNPLSVTKYSEAAFIDAAWDTAGRKVNKENWLKAFYQTAKSSIGIPVPEDSQSITMFKLILQEHLDLCKLRQKVEDDANNFLSQNADYLRLKSLPGIGPVIALTILAEAGDLCRFNHYKQFLKFCGFNLSTEQSGNSKGKSKLSKRGNARIRKAFWQAATVAIRMCENSFRCKYEHYVKKDPNNADLKRKAYTAVAVKMARVAYSLIKTQTDYHCFYEKVVPSGKIPSALPLRQI